MGGLRRERERRHTGTCQRAYWLSSDRRLACRGGKGHEPESARASCEVSLAIMPEDVFGTLEQLLESENPSTSFDLLIGHLRLLEHVAALGHRVGQLGHE